MTRQSAYRLRGKPGADSFAAAWDSALAFARTCARARRHPAGGFGGIDSILVPRTYRGRLVGFVQRDDFAGAMRVLRRLDRLADRLGDRASEGFEAFHRLTTGSDGGDGIPHANACDSSTPDRAA